MKQNEAVKGYIFSLLFSLVVACSTILIHKTNQFVNPYLSVFLTFLICTLWFHLINLKSLGNIYKQVFNNKLNVIIINVTTAIIWITTFKALEYIDPVLHLSIFMAFMPMATYFFGAIKHGNKVESKRILTCLAISCLLGMIIFVSKQSYLLAHMHDFYKGLILTVVASFASAIYMLYSKETGANLKLLPSQVVSIRFYFLLIYSGILCLQQHCFYSVNNIDYKTFILLALVSAIVPTYSVQKSIDYIGAVKTSFITPFTALFTYLLLLILHQQMSSFMLPLLLLLAIVLVYQSTSSLKPSRLKQLATDSSIRAG